jgi:hypothetical protein
MKDEEKTKELKNFMAKDSRDIESKAQNLKLF